VRFCAYVALGFGAGDTVEPVPVARRLRKGRLLELIGEWEAEHGQITEPEAAAARAELGIDRASPD